MFVFQSLKFHTDGLDLLRILPRALIGWCFEELLFLFRIIFALKGCLSFAGASSQLILNFYSNWQGKTTLRQVYNVLQNLMTTWLIKDLETLFTVWNFLGQNQTINKLNHGLGYKEQWETAVQCIYFRLDQTCIYIHNQQQYNDKVLLKYALEYISCEVSVVVL